MLEIMVQMDFFDAIICGQSIRVPFHLGLDITLEILHISGIFKWKRSRMFQYYDYQEEQSSEHYNMVSLEVI